MATLLHVMFHDDEEAEQVCVFLMRITALTSLNVEDEEFRKLWPVPHSITAVTTEKLLSLP
jgi:hypothetical protein